MCDLIFQFLCKHSVITKFVLAVLFCIGLSKNLLADSLIFSTFDNKNNIIFCIVDPITSFVESGQFSKGSFVTYAEQSFAIKRKLKKQKKRKIFNKLIKLKSLLRNIRGKKQAEDLSCNMAYLPPRDNVPTPIPTPQPTVKPPPIVVTTPEEICYGSFNSNGDTCGEVFGIPQGLTGNISVGRYIQENRCAGCHMERTGYEFPAVKTAVQNVPSMHGILDDYELDQAISDLVAYFNRFKG